MAEYYVGIDFGGMSAKAGLFDKNSKMLAKDTVKTSKDDNYVTTVAKMAQLVKKLCEENDVPIKSVRRIGLASPGVIDSKEGVVVRWGNYNWSDKPLARDMSEAVGAEVRVVNDANAAAYGEAIYGAAKAYKNSIFITLGTGIGSGIIIDGKLFEGVRGAGAEAGHMVIQVGGVPCGCGRKGCFEQYASASALIRDTKRAMFENKESIMWQMTGGDPENVDGKTAFAASREGDAAAQTVVKNYIVYLGEGILNLVSIFRPEAVILGGGVCNEGEYLLAPLRKYVAERLYVGCDKVPLTLNRAALGNDAGIYGALAFAMEK
ncbi:MAG TPA: ROK family protein [Candidatus Borkfalkia stercoripullorum]|nr:ROK family protein [Candidatus Borkfalkia stercoripullorum]